MYCSPGSVSLLLSVLVRVAGGRVDHGGVRRRAAVELLLQLLLSAGLLAAQLTRPGPPAIQVPAVTRDDLLTCSSLVQIMNLYRP